MLVRQAFRYELTPTPSQRAALANHAGAARWAWNWGLAVRRKAWQRRRERLGAIELHRLLNRLKRTPWYGWLYEVSKCAPQEALRDLDRAYANYWRARKTGRRRVELPRWKRPGSRNRARAARSLARLNRRVRNQRLDGLHKATTMLAKSHGVIVVEDLHVAGMVRNRHLARSIADQGWAEFQRQLAYKTRSYGSKLLVAPQFFPSSKTCSGCGLVKATLPLGARIFRCQGCGLVLDRDLNAARNLAQLVNESDVAVWVAGSSPETENACGAGGAGQTGNGLVELPAGKQERARIHGHTPTNS